MFLKIMSDESDLKWDVNGNNSEGFTKTIYLKNKIYKAPNPFFVCIPIIIFFIPIVYALILSVFLIFYAYSRRPIGLIDFNGVLLDKDKKVISYDDIISICITRGEYWPYKDLVFNLKNEIVVIRNVLFPYRVLSRIREIMFMRDAFNKKNQSGLTAEVKQEAK